MHCSGDDNALVFWLGEGVIGRGRERDIYRQTDRQTDRQTHIPIDAHTLTHSLPPSLSHTRGERGRGEKRTAPFGPSPPRWSEQGCCGVFRLVGSRCEPVSFRGLSDFGVFRPCSARDSHGTHARQEAVSSSPKDGQGSNPSKGSCVVL